MFEPENYNYKLSEKLIAQKPAARRDQAKLLIMHRETGKLSHRMFYEICDCLSPSDILVVNDTKVVPGRLIGKKDTGGKAELLILEYPAKNEDNKNSGEFICQCLINTSKRPKPGTLLFFDSSLKAEIINGLDGIYKVKFTFKKNFASLLHRLGKIPLPPYIKRDKNGGVCDDRTSYQTIYASNEGAVAAPTAGLHFSEKVIEKLYEKGIRIVKITLHVSYGTFSPVRVSDIRNHKIHSERIFISKASADTINRAKADGSRIIATGTTCVRALEHVSNDMGKVAPGSGSCDLFIYPGYKFKTVDAMITNFHLPQSTLLMLVSAFAGREKVLNAYREAKNKKYRFFSYGDAMLIT